jgi:hypothetical protein
MLARNVRALFAAGMLALVLCSALGSCSSLNFTRETQTSGRFRATGLSFTIISLDIPKSALDIARENASDSRIPNLQVERAVVFPHLGWFDWLLDIISFRFAEVSGTWGFSGEE